jgi:hypothetical protein
MLLIMEMGVWRDVEGVGVGDVVRGLFASRALVWGDVDSHGGALCRGARDADGGRGAAAIIATVIEA